MFSPKLQCPACAEHLNSSSGNYICDGCGGEYPIVNNIPILLSARNELFNLKTFQDKSSSGFNSDLMKKISKLLPDLTYNLGQDRALNAFINSLNVGSSCLIVGAGDDTNIVEQIESAGVCVKSTDVLLSKNVDYVCDVTALPFADDQYDCVVIVAVLEHVLDPIGAVSEITRVLKKGGIVFSAIPFMQQVHMGCYDFQRYTLLGHRWLYKSYTIIEWGQTSGAGSALLWSLNSFFQSFLSSKSTKFIAKGLVRLLLFWIKYFDCIQQNESDYALGTFIVGRNNKTPVINTAKLTDSYKYRNVR